MALKPLLLAPVFLSAVLPVQGGKLDSDTAAAGLREALEAGTSRAVGKVPWWKKLAGD